MAKSILNFSSDINSNAKKGDVVYYTGTAVVGGFATSDSYTKLGTIHSIINKKTIIVDITLNVTLPSANDFIFFSKDNDFQSSGVKGYYSEVKMVNDSKDKAELFKIQLDASQSSK